MVSRPELASYLSRHRLLNTSAPLPESAGLLQLCEEGFLVGGVAAALDVRPDEILGRLCQQMGGSALAVKIVDVRTSPVPEAWVNYGAAIEKWPLEGLQPLVSLLNERFVADWEAKAIALLGEWNDALCLWCVAKPLLTSLMNQPFFQPVNAAWLRQL